MGRRVIEKKKVESFLTPRYQRYLETIKKCKALEAGNDAEAIRRAIEYLANAVTSGEFSDEGADETIS